MATVVGHLDLGEADRIVRLLTAEHGALDAVARGARSSRRRFGGALDLGVRLRVAVDAPRRADGLSVLADVDVVAAPVGAREDLGKLMALAHGCEVARALSEPGAPQARLFALLGVWLDRLEAPAPIRPAHRVAMEAKALTFAGLAPALSRCARCGRPLTDPAAFSLDQGGAVHAGCAPGRAVLAEDLAALDRLRHTPLHEIGAGEVVAREVRWLLIDFLEHHTRRPLRSRATWAPLEED
jgi:DNA repair protein RecO (recombination protein O)